MRNSSRLRKIFYIFLWLLLWQLLSWLVSNDILFVGPIETLLALIQLAQSPLFFLSIANSLWHILLGIFLGSSLGILLAFGSHRIPWIREFFHPFVGMVKTIPVAAFVILLLVWLGSGRIALAISLLVSFPILYSNQLVALDALDPAMETMAHAFAMPRLSYLRCILLPQCLPALRSALSLAIGMGIKSGVAAEVIGQTASSLGNALYRSKIYLETGQLLAWTLVIFVLSCMLERASLRLLEYLLRAPKRKSAPYPSSEDLMSMPSTLASAYSDPLPMNGEARADADKKAGLWVKDLTVAHPDQVILRHFSYHFLPRQVYVITGPSGSGKSSLLLALLEQSSSAGIVFQENRLCPDFSAEDNVRLIAPGQISLQEAQAHIAMLFSPEEFKPEAAVATYSGGMQRRLAIARACASRLPLLLMDEPLTGLDQDNIDKTLRYIKKMQLNRPLIICAHELGRLPQYFPRLTHICVEDCKNSNDERI